MNARDRLEPVLIRHNDDITWTVMGEMVTDHLAVTPALNDDGYTGLFTLTHVPSGRNVIGFYSFRNVALLRRTARLLDNVAGADWSAEKGADVASGDVRAAVNAINKAAYEEAKEYGEVFA